jgi:AcrR family transcriptional regulator
VAGVTMSRRARLRSETVAEIKRTALALMTAGGPDAISLRAIAREMGMTAGAIYSYFPTRDDLITALITDVYTSLVETIEAARDAAPETDAGGRILAWGNALRNWAIAHPAGFRLIYGDPVTGYQPPAGGVATEAAHRACAGLTGLVAGAWPSAQEGAPPDYDWSVFDSGLAAQVQEQFPGLPPAAVALAMRLWGRMHGLVSLEVYGHLRPLTNDPARLYADELADLVRSYGLPVTE